MSTPLKWSLGILAVFLVLCCGGGIYLVTNVREEIVATSDDAEKAGDEILSIVGRSWNIADLKKAAVDGFSIDPTKLTDWKAKLGSLKDSQSKVTGISFKTDSNSPARRQIKYTSNAEFEKGKAAVTMELIKVGKGTWQVESFNVEPEASSSSEQSSL